MKRLGVVILALGLMMSVLTGCAKIIKTGTEAEVTGEKSFEETLDVSSFWDSQAIPEIREKAVDLKDFLTESNGDMKSLSSKYGKETAGATKSVTFGVHGTGTVTEVFTDKKAGYIVVDLDGYDGPEKIMIQIGSVIKKTAIRDFMSFINVNDYADQIQFAEVSKQINNYIMENVIAGNDIENSLGKQVEFYGCFTYDKADEVLIAPMILEVK